MKSTKMKNWLPHIAAILMFFALTAIYFAPVFQGKDLMQADAINSQGWGKDLRDYHEETGDYAYWSNAMFSGMPSNYTFSPQPVNIFAAADKVLTLGELRDALAANFAGYEELQKQMIAAPKYGNNEDIADKYGLSFENLMAKEARYETLIQAANVFLVLQL